MGAFCTAPILPGQREGIRTPRDSQARCMPASLDTGAALSPSASRVMSLGLGFALRTWHWICSMAALRMRLTWALPRPGAPSGHARYYSCFLSYTSFVHAHTAIKRFVIGYGLLIYRCSSRIHQFSQVPYILHRGSQLKMSKS